MHSPAAKEACRVTECHQQSGEVTGLLLEPHAPHAQALVQRAHALDGGPVALSRPGAEQPEKARGGSAQPGR